MKIEKFGVVGAGQMGQGIAQVAATCGLQVMLSDVNSEVVTRGYEGIKRNLQRSVEKEKISAKTSKKILKRISTTSELQDMAIADFVVEAATEEQDIKYSLFRELDTICPESVILATNTSSIPIGRIGAITDRPDKVIGMHFMNPVPVMELVEVIRGLETSDATFNTTWKLCETFNKIPVESSDFPGFIANRILMPMINEAIFCLYHGVGKADDIDKVMVLGMNHPMGPLALADLIGLDTCLAIMETLYDGFKDSKYRPCPLLRKYVEAGRFGRKSGKGFYEYQL